MIDLMTIGEFAAATWLSPKALRLYDRNGLLSPESVDPFNGYRRYSPAQIETARLISMLRRIDMPLEKVGELLNVTSSEQAAYVARYRKAEDERHARRQSLARFLEHAVGHGSFEGEGQPGASRFEVATRKVPEAPMLTSTRHTSARELPEVIQSSADKIITLAGGRGRGRPAGGLIVIYHGQVGWESDGPIEVCIPINDRDWAHRVEPGHEELFTRVLAEDVQFPRILAAFDAVRVRAIQLGFTPAGPPREVYSAVEYGLAPRCEVALPVIANES